MKVQLSAPTANMLWGSPPRVHCLEGGVALLVLRVSGLGQCVVKVSDELQVVGSSAFYSSQFVR